MSSKKKVLIVFGKIDGIPLPSLVSTLVAPLRGPSAPRKAFVAVVAYSSGSLHCRSKLIKLSCAVLS